jgi:hypothetical protein
LYRGDYPLSALTAGVVTPAQWVSAALFLAGVVVYGVLLFALGGLTRAEIRAALRRRDGTPAGEPDLS